tara:strand:- start:104 stop:652 length:549 start_codon:yes stop_codon:yes gene_type:complete
MSNKYFTEIDFSEQIIQDDALAKKFTTKYRNNLPDSDFAYIEPGGKKVDGKTEPRSLRHFPIPDAAHVRNALARLSQSKLSPAIKAKILKKLKSKAKEFGIEVSEESKAGHNDYDSQSIEEHFKGMRESLRQKMQNQDSYDVKHETLKELRKHHEDAIKNIDQEIKSLKKDKVEDQGDVGQE